MILKDKVVIITGAGLGMGQAACRGAAKEGAKVVVTARSKQAIEEIAADIVAGGGEAIAVPVDVTDFDQCKAAADAALAALVAEYGDKSHYQYAQIHAQWGDIDKALAALQAAWNLRDGGMMLMYADPLLAPLHRTDGYLALAKAVGFI